MENPQVLKGFNSSKAQDLREFERQKSTEYLLVTGNHQQAMSYFPGTASMAVRVLASRSQLKVANIRWPSDALLGIRARQASSVSPWVPVDTRVGPVFTALTLPLDDGEAGVPVSPVAPLFVSAHPMAKVARLKEAHRNNLEIGFIGQTPPQWINKSRNILENLKKNKMGWSKSYSPSSKSLGPFPFKNLDWYRVYCYGKISLQSSKNGHKFFMAYLIARLSHGSPGGQGQLL